METGIRALTVHFRTQSERPRDPAHYEMLADIARICPVPVIANGDIFRRDQIPEMLGCGASSVMLGRAAQWNPSIFRAEGELHPTEVTRAYLRTALEVDNPFPNTKYTVLQMWLDRPYSDRKFSVRLQQSKTIAELSSLFDLSLDGAGDADRALLHNAEDDG